MNYWGHEDSDVTDDLDATGESALALLDNGEAIFDLKPSFWKMNVMVKLLF